MARTTNNNVHERVNTQKNNRTHAMKKKAREREQEETRKGEISTLEAGVTNDRSLQ